MPILIARERLPAADQAQEGLASTAAAVAAEVKRKCRRETFADSGMVIVSPYFLDSRKPSLRKLFDPPRTRVVILGWERQEHGRIRGSVW
jgi:hypothetical protein